MSDREIEIPVYAVREWVSSTLILGGSDRAFSRLVNSLPWDVAKASTLAGADTSESTVLKFQTGGITSTNRSDPWLMKKVEESLRGCDGKILIEDWSLEKGDEIIGKFEDPAIYDGKSVYYIADHRKPSWTLATIGLIPGYVGLVIEGDIPVGVDFSKLDIDELGGRVLALYCGAYDGEGYIYVGFRDESKDVSSN